MKKEFIVSRQGKDFVLYAGLLDQAHHEGLKKISTTLLQSPSADNGHMAICHAEVETEKGTFTGIGDASPDSVGRMIAVHTIRMAETRAKARALRDAINVGVTAFEELGDVDEDSSEVRPVSGSLRPSRSTSAVPRGAAPRPENLDTSNSAEPQSDDADQAGGFATQQQIDKLHKLQSALGRPAMVSNNLSSEEATRLIAELVRVFNAQARGGAGTRAR